MLLAACERRPFARNTNVAGNGLKKGAICNCKLARAELGRIGQVVGGPKEWHTQAALDKLSVYVGPPA